MVLDKHRNRLDWWLVPLAKAFRNVDPNVFTWISLAAAVGAGVAFWQSGPGASAWLLALAAVLVGTNGVLDVLDGKVAKLTGKDSAKGDYLDHAVDRFSDVAFITGIALSGWARVEIGLAAIVFTLLTSYLGTQAQAVGIGRNYGGLLGRADRIILLILVPWAQFALAATGTALPAAWLRFSPSLLDTLLIYFAVMGLVTTMQRFGKGLGGFDGEGRVK